MQDALRALPGRARLIDNVSRRCRASRMRCHAGTDGHHVASTLEKVEVSSSLIHSARWALLNPNAESHTKACAGLLSRRSHQLDLVTWREVDAGI